MNIELNNSEIVLLCEVLNNELDGSLLYADRFSLIVSLLEKLRGE